MKRQIKTFVIFCLISIVYSKFNISLENISLNFTLILIDTRNIHKSDCFYMKDNQVNIFLSNEIIKKYLIKKNFLKCETIPIKYLFGNYQNKCYEPDPAEMLDTFYNCFSDLPLPVIFNKEKETRFGLDMDEGISIRLNFAIKKHEIIYVHRTIETLNELENISKSSEGFPDICEFISEMYLGTSKSCLFISDVKD